VCCNKWVTSELALVFLFEQCIDIALLKLSKATGFVYSQKVVDREIVVEYWNTLAWYWKVSYPFALFIFLLQTMFSLSMEILLCCP
jgi:hypothetical protein